ncbi:iron complex transport system permease protein [Microbacterium trichothecenolyticum]|uniref:FecCD family ABC transporter permease n=1 Tax=Microbacterium trichothecenolyticum TaxID=69370 RepID=UPI0028582486|nr:iron chelate uptake ABC transporter family permease subunit [Microbacterium trichothecenolyticum]MDR7111717.1 iron complex transport system permease protein [Microbacterium trichothecenolyticum]
MSTDTFLHPAAQAVVIGRRRRSRRRVIVTAALAVGVVLVFVASLMIGQTFYGLDEVVRVVLGQTVPGASFTVGELRLPRAVLAILAGFAFGIAGVTFQTMLRNPLASPDIIGITAGASAAAVFGIVILSLSETAVSVLAVVGGLATALAIYLLSNKGGFAGTRLILIGIGVAAMLDAAVTYVLSKAPAYDLQAAMRWLTGSLNGATWSTVLPLAIASVVLVPALLAKGRDLNVLRLGDDAAASLGIRLQGTRVVVIVAAVALLAFATAATGPIAFVAFMAGPIAARIVGPGGSLLLPSALVGALLVQLSDLLGQFAFDSRYPVGVVTGVLGAPFLISLLIRTNRSGGSL